MIIEDVRSTETWIDDQDFGLALYVFQTFFHEKKRRAYVDERYV